MDLTADQQQAVESGEAVPVVVGRTECVIVRRDVYEWGGRAASPDDWTVEEMNLLADEADAIISRSEADEG
jgi:hypothetical protein